jgi:hypothetical protein
METDKIMALAWERLQKMSPEEKKAWRKKLYKRMEEDEMEEEQKKQVTGENDNKENQG